MWIINFIGNIGTNLIGIEPKDNSIVREMKRLLKSESYWVNIYLPRRNFNQESWVRAIPSDESLWVELEIRWTCHELTRLLKKTLSKRCVWFLASKFNIFSVLTVIIYYCNLMNQALPLPSLKEFCLHRFNPEFAPDRWS